ncbi:MAG: hypothetical protein EOO96_05925 [Pedobacter sp.]|nr:MAG: hypothetical protein EOO96_05925 [Pedobacter sp.]
MRKSIFNAITLVALCLSTNIAFGQKDKLVGTWEFVKVAPPNAEKICYTSLRTFDEKGDYIQIAATANGAVIQAKGRFEIFEEGIVKELITFTPNPDRKDKTFNFNYRFVTEGNHNLMIIEGGTKVVNGYATVEWREVWRKVEEYKQ